MKSELGSLKLDSITVRDKHTMSRSRDLGQGMRRRAESDEYISDISQKIQNLSVDIELVLCPRNPERTMAKREDVNKMQPTEIYCEEKKNQKRRTSSQETIPSKKHGQIQSFRMGENADWGNKWYPSKLRQQFNSSDKPPFTPIRYSRSTPEGKIKKKKPFKHENEYDTVSKSANPKP